MLELLLYGLLLGASAAAQPGPFQAYLIQQTLEQGTRRALPAVIAPLLSDGPVVVLVCGVLSSVPPWAVRLLGIGGGAYLLWLAACGMRFREPPESGLSRGLLHGALVNLLAPGPYLFWGLVLGPLVLGAARESLLAAATCVTAFYLAMMATNAGVVLAFGWASTGNQRLRGGLRAASVIALGGFGLYSLVRGFLAP